MAIGNMCTDWHEYWDATRLWFVWHIVCLKKSPNESPYLVARIGHNCLIIRKCGHDVGMNLQITICDKTWQT